MDKEQLLRLIEQDSSFLETFIDEYKQDGIDFNSVERLIDLFSDMKQCIKENRVPESLKVTIME